jgi:hypothetical protein
MLLASQMRNFKKVGKAYNFSCPICGDSEKNPRKARGYFFEKGDKLIYHCHNCGIGATVKSFLERVDISMFKEYNMETFVPKPLVNKKSEYEAQIENFSKRRSENFAPLKELKKISSLPIDHKARKYIEKRKVPNSQHYKLYYAPKFNAWVNKILPNKLNEERDDERVVIPFCDFNGYCFAAAGRALDDGAIRYITVKFDQEKPKIFGLDTVDLERKVYVVEGPIDSLFIPNCIAFAGSSGDLDELEIKEKVIILDNEPRNKDTVQNYNKMIKAGEKMFIWPDNYSDVKDINDLVVKYEKKDKELLDFIDENVYNGLEAQLRVNNWKKI